MITKKEEKRKYFSFALEKLTKRKVINESTARDPPRNVSRAEPGKKKERRII